MGSALAVAVFVAAALCVAGLTRLVVRDGLGAPVPLSTPRGSARAGIAYALGPGLSPFAKESARSHLGIFLAGVVFHLGVLVAVAWLILTVSPSGAWASSRGVWSVALFAGVACGLALLGRRLSSPVLRSISVPDDYVSNVLTSGFVTLALISVWAPSLVPALHVVAALLLLYIPFGKIRHCVFFFIARARFGALFGHRGALPPAPRRAHS